MRAEPSKLYAMKTLMYLAYGTGSHVDETIYSLYTAARFIPFSDPQLRYLIYTDNPDAFSALPVEIRTIGSDELTAWLGPTEYIHRRKLMAFIDALQRFKGQIVLVDSDTYFRRSPAKIFERVKPGRACFHVMESTLRNGETPGRELGSALAATDIYDEHGERIPFSGNDRMWNSGVFGIDAADLDTLMRAPALLDQIWNATRSRVTEQFVVGYLFSRDQEPATSHDVVYHYWMSFRRNSIDVRLPAILAKLAALPAEERPRTAYAERPMPPIRSRVKAFFRERLWKVGIRIGGISRSA